MPGHVPDDAPAGSRHDAYPWRLLATGLSFSLFGAGGLLLGAVVMPLLLVWPGTQRQRQERVRRMVGLSFRMFIGFMRGTGVLSCELAGFDRLGRPGQLVVANHPSLIDVVFLLAFTPGAACVVKSALWRNPATALVVRGAGYVPNSPTALMIERAAAALHAGDCLVMFPEGTRSLPGEPLRFQRGAASVAVRAARCVTPVFVTVEPTTLTKGEPWYRIPRRRPHFSLRVGPDLEPARGDCHPPPKASRELNERLLTTYAAGLPKY